MILLDDRGHAPDKLSERLPQLGVESTVTRLLEGDAYWDGIEQCWAEFKTADDLVTSLKTGHMQDQEARMLELPGRKFVFIEGELRVGERGTTLAQHKLDVTSPRAAGKGKRGYDFSDKSGRVYRSHEYPYKGVLNYMARLQDFGVTVLSVANADELAASLAATYYRSMKPSHARPIRQKFTALDPRVASLGTLFPGVPMKALESLVQTYWRHPLNDLSDIPIGELLALPGGGRKTIERVTGR